MDRKGNREREGKKNGFINFLYLEIFCNEENITLTRNYSEQPATQCVDGRWREAPRSVSCVLLNKVCDANISIT